MYPKWSKPLAWSSGVNGLTNVINSIPNAAWVQCLPTNFHWQLYFIVQEWRCVSSKMIVFAIFAKHDRWSIWSRPILLERFGQSKPMWSCAARRPVLTQHNLMGLIRLLPSESAKLFISAAHVLVLRVGSHSWCLNQCLSACRDWEEEIWKSVRASNQLRSAVDSHAWD